jgi:hypothetical protein
VNGARGTLIEGSLREITLADVLQLLDLGRKSGVLCVTDAFGRTARVTLVVGRIRDAALDGRPARGDRQVRDVVIELLGWGAGRFAVEPLDTEAARGASIGVDSVLMEAARQADEWERLADRVPGAHVVPRLSAAGDAAPVALAPEEWEVLAYADGTSDLRAIAGTTGRDLLAIAGAVHRLVGEGLVSVADPADAVPHDGERSSES